MKKLLLTVLLVSSVLVGVAGHEEGVGKRFSTAGFFQLQDTPRKVYSINPSWLLHVGTLNDSAAKVDFDDSKWQAVNLPNGIEILTNAASGGKNYRGHVWYRKHFVADKELDQSRITLHFEAIMGKSKVWLNGELVKEHFGGFTPIVIDVTGKLKCGEENVIAVWADNSDDPMYPPGKPQGILDFCYFGGIYRDCFLVMTNKETYITDANEVDKIAGGGVIAQFKDVSEHQATIALKTDFVGKAKVLYILKNSDGEIVYKGYKSEFTVKNPKLWSPQYPNLYQLEVRLIGAKNRVLDGYMIRLGIKSVKFTYQDGLILNGKPYPRKLIGANRHQDFAVVGNALSNSLHYRDAAKLKAAGLEIIRNAHYPQDPAFMDACNELGLFVIVNTPGWQFWNEAPIFEQRVYTDIRTMIRRDRNHPSVLMWEPILNETWYPEMFAKNVHNIVKEEIPYDGANYTSADMEARGSKYFDVIFTHPASGAGEAHGEMDAIDTTKVYFTREWGDNVDDWNSHNSPSRVMRAWGEKPMLVQAFHYANPPYNQTNYEILQNTPAYHMGGTLWHSFDHQRGYHPDPFYGGIMDAFRRPKTSYYMFQAQAKHIEPMVYMAHEMTPFSDADVVVFSNCDAVRLRTFVGDTIRTKKCDARWVVFENAWDFMKDKEMSRGGKQRDAYFLVEGLDKEGNVVASQKKAMARRPAKLRLEVDTMSLKMVANGGDLAVVTAQVIDEWGDVKRLNGEHVIFSIEGEGKLIGSPDTFTNPVLVEWGEASILVQSTTNVGKIKINAQIYMGGENSPLDGQIEFETVKPTQDMIYDKDLQKNVVSNSTVKKLIDSDAQKTRELLKEVEKQQSDFGEK